MKNAFGRECQSKVPHNKVANLGHDPGPSDLFPPLAIVPLPHNEPSVPSQQGFRCDDSGDFCQEFPAKRLTLHREPTSPGVSAITRTLLRATV